MDRQTDGRTLLVPKVAITTENRILEYGIIVIVVRLNLPFDTSIGFLL